MITLSKMYCQDSKEFGVTIDRKTWIKNWRMNVLWNRYFDYQMCDVEGAIIEYCERNDLEFCIDGGWLYCISNRKQYNDIMKIVNEILDELYGGDWD